MRVITQKTVGEASVLEVAEVAEPVAGPGQVLVRVGAAGVNPVDTYIFFSLNDFASNGGILVAGGLVMWLDQAWPDLVVGMLVAAIAVKGGIEILRSASDEGEGASP